MSDLDAAVAYNEQAVEITPEDHINRAGYLVHLGNVLRLRSNPTGAIRCWREAAGIQTAPPLVRMEAAREWGRRAFEAGDAASAADGYATGVALLPQVAWHGLDRATQEEQVAEWADMAANAAACAIAAGRPRQAVEVLEQGRSVLWTHVLRLRSDLTLLRERAPGLADRMDEVRRVLDRSSSRPGGVETPGGGMHIAAEEQAMTDRRHLAREWDDLLAQVRQLDGFEHFLQAVPFAELRAGATGPVVIINISDLGCHALIVTATSDPGVRLVPLPGLSYQEAATWANTLLKALRHLAAGWLSLEEEARRNAAVFDVLEWLWRVIAEPVLEVLRHTDPPLGGTGFPRVWWCPTGPLTVLPLHAAGRYSRTAGTPANPGETVHGRVISSYTPTLTALRRTREATPAAAGAVRQLVVGMPTTAGQDPLPAVPAELEVLAGYFPPPHAARHLVAEDATQRAVMEALPDYPWVHFACHATQDQGRPTDSAFALWDGPLTLESLTTLRTHPAELAFLSACQTAAATTQLPDEAVHLAAAMQLLGYRHVIATLWAIADTPTPDVARAVYGKLTQAGHPDVSHAAEATHHAVESIRNAYPANPLLWAPYIHIGP